MTLEEIYKYYGSAKACARELGVAKNTPLHWKSIGYIPMKRQIEIEKLTNGMLKADMKHTKREEKVIYW